MKRIAGLILILALTLLVAPAIFAQQSEEHGEVGVFVDVTRLHHANNTNFWGPGAQIGFNVGKYAQLEASMAYDPEKTVSFTNNTATTQEGLRLLSGLFGPKIQTAWGPVKVFGVVKGGFLNFGVSNKGVATGFANQVGTVPHGDTNGVLYPGGGVEFFAKWFGVRAEVGDEIYFDNGANHNLKFQVGPTFRW